MLCSGGSTSLSLLCVLEFHIVANFTLTYMDRFRTLGWLTDFVFVVFVPVHFFPKARAIFIKIYDKE